jgi:hypothetical protein
VAAPAAGGLGGPVPERAACNFVSVKMSPDGSYYSMDCKGPDVPYSCVHHTATNSLTSVWADNRYLAARYRLDPVDYSVKIKKVNCIKFGVFAKSLCFMFESAFLSGLPRRIHMFECFITKTYKDI